ncbi:unnamed protein product [Bursaphelenchus okinawaensis]|uniref:Uncharacterized protein n=1 Tax=Bursaphelenchus okinawaensis TaxID=465554 RepID=A0A811L9H8_9BILA|nr:unnamed protein product [Bursaphelenchus okinawaensis]CAG9120386.1 unnamed protein product [Bursaphelenchus okinawaensis]
MNDYDQMNFQEDVIPPVGEVIQVGGDASSQSNVEVENTYEEEVAPKLEVHDDQTQLICEESMNIDKDLFNDDIPGHVDFERGRMSNLAAKRGHQRFRTELEPEDVKLVNEMGQLTAEQLMDYMRKIKDQACCLGNAQSEQCKRAKLLKIFQT